jgi:hypothetical protein
MAFTYVCGSDVGWKINEIANDRQEQFSSSFVFIVCSQNVKLTVTVGK